MMVSDMESSSLRLNEILQVLRRHELLKGISPQKLKNVLEDLGPIYVKIGQIMSVRSGLLPSEYRQELRELHANVSPISFTEVEAQIRTAYGREIEEIFMTIDTQPIGSASIAQVHRATLLDGRSVVVKVQRPQIQEIIRQDIELLHKAIRLLGHVTDKINNFKFEAILDEIWKTLQLETDFLMEAEHLRIFANLNQNVAYISCPKLEQSLITSKTFVMEYVEGIPIDHLDELKKAKYDLDEIGTRLAENYIKQILDDGFFHADPHPGNLVIRDGKIAWLDFGIIGRLSNRDRMLFREIALAVIRMDTYGLKDLLLTLGETQGEIDHAKFHSEIDMFLKKYATMDVQETHFGKLTQEMWSFVQEHNITIPAEMITLTRGLINLEGLLAFYYPNVNLLTTLTNSIFKDWQTVFTNKKDLARLGISLSQFLRKSLDLPTQLSDVINMTTKGQIKINLVISLAEKQSKEISSITDKLVIALIIVALFIGSGLLCGTDMKPQVLGIPLTGLLGYALGILLSLCLAYAILRKMSNK